jgi:hypothetical protein
MQRLPQQLISVYIIHLSIAGSNALKIPIQHFPLNAEMFHDRIPEMLKRSLATTRPLVAIMGRLYTWIMITSSMPNLFGQHLMLI